MKEFWRGYPGELVQRLRVSNQLNLLVGALIVGILGGYGAIGVRALIRLVQDIAWGGWGDPVEFLGGFHWGWIILIPTVGGLLTGLIVHFVAPEAKGHGVPEVMEAIVLKNGIIRSRVPLAKALASAISIGTGGSIGREGPLVQIGAAVGSLFGKFTRAAKGDVKTFVGCGAAAGIAGTFNAPLAGALFALEVILGDFGVGKFSPIIVSSVAATAVSRYYLGSVIAFKIPAYELVSLWEYGLYAILGLITGVVAVIFIQTLYKTEDIFKAIPAPQYLKTMFGGLLIGGIALLYPQVFGVGYETMSQVLSGKLLWHVAGVLIAAKMIATSVTLGSGASGGVFAPSLFLGAMTGGVVGELGGFFVPFNIAPSGAYALVGMAGLLGGGDSCSADCHYHDFRDDQRLQNYPARHVDYYRSYATVHDPPETFYLYFETVQERYRYSTGAGLQCTSYPEGERSKTASDSQSGRKHPAESFDGPDCRERPFHVLCG